MNHTLRTLGATLAAGICFGTAAAQETTQQALTLQEAIELSYGRALSWRHSDRHRKPPC